MNLFWKKSIPGQIRKASLGLLFSVGSLCAQGGTVTATYTFPDLPLGAFQNTYLPETITNDRGILLGGVGSDLWRDPSDGPGVFWMITDRGPNGGTAAKRTFPVPEFTPFILNVKVENGSINILQAIPITASPMKGTTGVSNYPGTDPIGDEKPWNCNSSAPIPFNPNGLDPEGIVRARDGNFWVVEEYRPSIVKIDPTGLILKRFVPLNDPLAGTDYPVSKTLLPEILNRRKRNRGFEGIAISPNQKTLFAAVQSPEWNPDKATGDASRNERLIVFDLENETVVAEYVYRFDVPTTDTYGTTNPAEMKISGLSMLDEHRMLVLERTDQVARIYRVDLRQGTDILGTKWDSLAQSPSLEKLGESGQPTLEEEGITPLPKELVIDLSKVAGVPGKIEGIAALNDGKSIAISNDNDFDVGTFDASCNNTGTGVKSQILIIKTDNPLK